MRHSLRIGADAEQWMQRGLTNETDDGAKTINIVFILRQILRSDSGASSIVQVYHALLAETAIVHNAIVDRELTFGIATMQGINMLHQLSALVIQLLSRFMMTALLALLFDMLHDRSELLHKVTLGCLV